MSADTHYTVLGVSQSATRDEIKRAYRNLIRQVHPDSVPNASPYWKQASEQKSKEINEAYRVLMDGDQRRSYDERLANDRGNYSPVSSARAPAASVITERVPNRHPASSSRRERDHRARYNWRPVMRWVSEYPFLAGCLLLVVLAPMISLVVGFRHKATDTSLADAFALDGHYSALPCLDPNAIVSPIDGKPCPQRESTIATPAPDSKSPVRLTTPRWFYVTTTGSRPLNGVPDDATCKRFDAPSPATCEASLKYCPQGTLSKNCVSYSKWKRSNIGPPRVEKPIPEWPSE